MIILFKRSEHQITEDNSHIIIVKCKFFPIFKYLKIVHINHYINNINKYVKFMTYRD